MNISANAFIDKKITETFRTFIKFALFLAVFCELNELGPGCCLKES